MQKIPLVAMARELQEQAAGTTAGRAARTVMGGHERVLRQTVIALAKDTTMTEHVNPGEATVYVLHGRVVMEADGNTWSGRDGDLLIVPDAPHSLRALEDASVILTVAKRP